MSKALIAAIEANDPDAVRLALKGIKDINRKLPGASKPLLYAAEKGADKALATLFEAGAIAEKRHTFSGDTPFAVAAKHRQTKIMAQLVSLKQASAGAVEHAVDNAIMENDPPVLELVLQTARPKLNVGSFHLAAAQLKGLELLEILLKYGGDPKARFDVHDSKNTTLFHELVSNGRSEIMKLLLAHGAEINSRDGSGCTPLMILAQHLESLDPLNPGVRFRQGLVSKGLLVSPGRLNTVPDSLEAIQTLLQAGADASLVDDSGNDSMDHCLFEFERHNQRTPNAAIIKLLSQAGAKGSPPTHELFAALRAKNPDALRQAIAKGADVNRLTPSQGNLTPLTVAANNPFSEALTLVNILLEAGADPNKCDRAYTPLIYAARSGNLEVVKALINAGADIHIVCVCGDLIENVYSAVHGNDDLRQYLKSLGAENPRPQKSEALKPGVENWNDFSEVLAKTTVQQAAAALSKMINGRATFDLFEKTVVPGKNAFVVVRAKGMAWCNIFQVAPANQWLNDSKNIEPFAAKLAKASGASVLAIQYSDTSDAATIFRAEPDGKSTSDAGFDNDLVEEMVGTMGDQAPAWAKKQLADADEDDSTSTERLEQLARREKFVVAAFDFCGGPGQKLELELPGYDPAQFDGLAFITS